MRSTVSTLATVAAGLFATTASAQGKVAIYWGQGAYQKELSVVCQDPSVDIVNIAFVNGFPQDRTTYPDTNFGKSFMSLRQYPTKCAQEMLVVATISQTPMAHQANSFPVVLP